MDVRIFPRKIVCLSGIVMIMLSCRKEDKLVPDPPPTGPVTQWETNKWILDSMRYYYLWNTTLPVKADTQLTAIPYFNTLKQATDSFSQIIDLNDIPGTSKKDFLHTFGFDFAVVSINGIEKPLGLLKFVIPGSAIWQDGLRRGDYFTKINNTPLTPQNAQQLSEDILNDHKGSLTKADIAGNVVTETGEVPLQGATLQENPLYIYQTFENQGHPTGYIFYNYFDDFYNTNLLNAFIKLKQDNIKDLIIDLRYNPGGSVAAAAAMIALIAPATNENSILARYTGNKQMGSLSVTFKQALAVPESRVVVPFSQLAAGRSSISRVFILTTHQTASASELVINNLKPYLQVITIGERTYGKDKGAVVITDMRTPRRLSWALAPITYLLSNAKGEGNYTTGIAPDYTVYELNTQPLLPMGDPADPFIAKALSVIRGDGRTSAYPERITTSLYDTRTRASRESRLILPR
ncbi:S41 family peptidase [Chitinophaga filiformis]|uniref:Peptidase family S41 n=1 Tax=Chitinophaga filiformis TaxID=104663 RepID=A0A1G7WNX1_CHIFI|nr:S41 family peptidase [Chitinophaga filiformis]SDG73603.1 Peptidase family S41 [Chitinophaga filiformis]